MLYPVWVLENQFQNKNGSNLVNGKVYVYHQGRSSLANIFQDEDGNFAQSNPVTLDANARGVAYADSSFVYTIVVCDFYNKELFSYDTRIGGAGGTSGSKIVIHDATLSGYGTTYSPLGAVTLPLAVDETMTAYTANVGGKESLVLGVEGDWFNNTFNSALSSKVDLSAFEECCASVKGSLSGKADLSILENYYNKTEINSALGDRVTYEFLNENVYKKYQTSSKEELASAFASAGQGGDGNCPWISGTKVIADTQTLTSNMIVQILSSFDLSGYKNHNIGMKGGTYRFPNEYEIGSALLHTNYFMHLSGMSAYLPISSFSSYTASIQNSLNSNWDYTNSAYSLSLNNFYNKLDASAFSSYSAGQDSTLNNITNQITNISNASGNWNEISSYQQNSANYLTAINIPESASWNEATNVVQTNSSVWNNKLDLSAFENASGNFYPMTGNPSGFLTEHQDLSYISGKIDDKLDTTALENLSGEFYPMTGNPSGFLTEHQSLEDYYKKTETSSKEEISAAIASIPQGDPDVNNFVQTNSSTIVDVDNVVQTNSGDWGGGLTGSYVPTSAIGYTMIIEDAGRLHPTAISGSSIWAPSAGNAKFALTAFTANRAEMDKDGYWINAEYVKNSAFNNSASYWNNAINYISSVTTPTTDRTFLSGAIDYVSAGVDYVSANGGKTYTGVAPIQVNNTSNEISISGESLSAGPNIDLFESGGYVVISANGGNSFPITGSNGTTAYTANMDCSSVLLTTASSPAGGYVKQTVQGVQYEAYPATDVSASWYNIINATNNRGNCYCIRFTNDMTAADLANYSAYDKVTVVHSNEYTPDCHLYWDGNTKVFPSGLYCELVKGTNDQNQIDWFFTTSGWTNNLWWDWD